MIRAHLSIKSSIFAVAIAAAFALCLQADETVSTPMTPAGPSGGIAGVSYTYSTGGAVSSYGYPIQYRFVWRDGSDSDWLPVGATSASHAWAAAGQYAISVWARSAVNTWNATQSGSLLVTITPSPNVPDLVVTSLTTPSVAATGGQINVSATVTNQGTGPAGAFWLKYYVSTMPMYTNSAIDTNTSCHTNSVAPGATYSCSGPITLLGLTPGTWYLIAYADPANEVAEADETNNTKVSGPINVQPGTETVTTPTPPSGPTAGTPGTSYTYSTAGAISNLGNPVQYFFDWGDGTNSGWLAVGTTSASHSWSLGSYSVTAQARSATNTSVVSSRSSAFTVAISGTNSVVIQTSPAGLQFTVDGGAPQTAPQTLNLSQGIHTIAVVTTQPSSSPDMQYVFSGWSDYGGASHTITVNGSGAIYKASFKTQYRLTITAWPSYGGSVTPATGQFYDAGSVVMIGAVSNSGFMFVGWSGNVADVNSASTTATISAAFTLIANFGPAQAPSAVTVFTPEQGTVDVSTTVTLSWQAVAGATSYDIHFGTSATPPFVFSTSGLTYSTGTLLPNTDYYWSVTAKNAFGSSPTGVWTFKTGGLSTGGYHFVPTTPCRVFDTRGPNGVFGGPAIPAQGTRNIPVPLSNCNIPTTAVAYSLNVTVVPPEPLTYLSIWPAGQTQPVVSTLNSFDGRIVANAAIVPAGAQGAINVFASDQTHVIIDINGFFAPATAPNGLSFYTLAPCRVADTRNATGPLGGPYMAGNSTRSFPIPTSSCGAPNTALAYAFNITVAPHGPLGYLSTWPAGQSQPNVSTLNSPSGGIVANAAIVPAGTNGAVSFFVTDDTDVIIDINGYFALPGSPAAQSLYTVTPCRVADTRGGSGLPAYGSRNFAIPTSGCTGIPSTAQAYSLNVTVVPSGQTLFYLTAWPTGQGQPGASTLNSPAGKVVANAAIVPAGTGGAICVFVTDPADLILDINAYFVP